MSQERLTFFYFYDKCNPLFKHKFCASVSATNQQITGERSHERFDSSFSDHPARGLRVRMLVALSGR